jgi:CrcB protein
MGYLLVGLGGAFGSAARFIIGKRLSETSNSWVPLGTFFVNISGAILLGIVSSINIDNNLYLLIGDGFLGAYTTFSTFMYEGFNLFKEDEKKNTGIYVSGTFIFGIIGFIIGIEVAKLF